MFPRFYGSAATFARLVPGLDERGERTGQAAAVSSLGRTIGPSRGSGYPQGGCVPWPLCCKTRLFHKPNRQTMRLLHEAVAACHAPCCLIGTAVCPLFAWVSATSLKNTLKGHLVDTWPCEPPAVMQLQPDPTSPRQVGLKIKGCPAVH